MRGRNVGNEKQQNGTNCEGIITREKKEQEDKSEGGMKTSKMVQILQLKYYTVCANEIKGVKN